MFQLPQLVDFFLSESLRGISWTIPEIGLCLRMRGAHIPRGSMYAIYGNIYHQYTPNVSIYTIHGSYGICKHADFRAAKIGFQQGSYHVFLANNSLDSTITGSHQMSFWPSGEVHKHRIKESVHHLSVIVIDLFKPHTQMIKWVCNRKSGDRNVALVSRHGHGNKS